MGNIFAHRRLILAPVGNPHTKLDVDREHLNKALGRQQRRGCQESWSCARTRDVGNLG